MKSVIEISRRDLLKNFSYLKSFSKNLYLTIKANAYGHGVSEIVEALKGCDFHGFSLATNEEIFEINNINKIKKNFLIMSPILDEYFFEIVQRFLNVEFFVYSIELLKELDFWTKKNKKNVKIHLKVETGMNRLGISLAEIETAIDLVKNNLYIELIGLATHYGDVYRYDDSNIQKQQENFSLFYKKIISEKSFKSLKFFNGGSSGTIDLNYYNTIRAGSYLYGFWKSEDVKRRILEKNSDFKISEIMNWKAKILQIKFVEEGQYLGYGIETIAKKKIKIALISVGYSDGFCFLFSKNKNGYALINGKKAPLIGLMSMNIATIDITEINKVDLESEVFLINKNFEGFSIKELSEKIGISSLQFSTLISKNIKRVLVDA